MSARTTIEIVGAILMATALFLFLLADGERRGEMAGRIQAEARADRCSAERVIREEFIEHRCEIRVRLAEEERLAAEESAETVSILSQDEGALIETLRGILGYGD